MTRDGEPLPEFPDFDAFYGAVNGRVPFPWQSRLARQVGEEGIWPAEIGVPTGLGKTACLDIAVWWLASQAELAPAQRTAPTRIWWVVNRRLLVDEASRHAARLDNMLRRPAADGREAWAAQVLKCVAARLRSLSGSIEGEPLHVIPLRGGLALRRPPNPAQPSVIVSTIPMYGSRLLFRGFGSSMSMRPVDAAHAGTDSLVLVDEAHLARHLRELIPKLEQCIPDSAETPLPAGRTRPQVVALTATGDADPVSRFELADDDYANEIVRRRLDAPKPVRVDADTTGNPAKALRDRAVELLSDADSPASCVIFCNTPATAREAYSLIARHPIGGSAEVLLVTGRTRQGDADALRERLLSPEGGAPALSGMLPERRQHLIVIATQTLEVGADLDFEYLVTEQCGVRALTQRLGRLNRLGRYAHAKAVYVHRPPRRSRSSWTGVDDIDGTHRAGAWPVYGKEPEAVLERFDRQGFDETINLSPRLIGDVLGEPADDPGRAPAIMPGLLWEWIKTSTPAHGEAPVEPYFSGIAEPQRSASVVWRIFVPGTYSDESQDLTQDDDILTEAPAQMHRLWPRVAQDEVVEVPVGELRAALRAAGMQSLQRSRDGNAVEPTRVGDLRPGDLAVLPVDAGMCDEFGWSPESRIPVTDLSVRRSGLPLDRDAISRLCGSGAGEADPEIAQALRDTLGDAEDAPDEVAAGQAAANLTSILRDRTAAGFEPGDWQVFLDALAPTPESPPNEVPRLEQRQHPRISRVDEFDEVSACEALPPEARELLAHGKAVGQRAHQVASALGLAEPIARVIRDAGEFHDIGKADARFQRWLDPAAALDDPTRVPLAKSAMPTSRWSGALRDAGWPLGGRHEELSARLLKEWLSASGNGHHADDRHLLVHLVISHHGKGRPLVTPVADGTPEPVRWKFPDGSEVSADADLAKTDWNQPSRFRRLNDRHGPWGLALMETILRQADHEVSADGVHDAVEEVQ
ncbi:MAG: type I-U CRISPR-associated helicase/endonuclease Cas3 [Acidimicrobiaceae bacterium]|nr:type I-U CRISPR-associated helicase/endonuclease Cas3 [Acidimicrobiaceae bacterium]